jgi:hypothetical protein
VASDILLAHKCGAHAGDGLLLNKSWTGRHAAMLLPS